MRVCKQCGLKNEENVRYCQKCGAKLECRVRLFQKENFKLWGGFNMKGISIAPLACMGIKNEAERELGKVSKIPKLAHVKPREDGSWFCPDCGDLNARFTKKCKGCGRDFI